MSAAARLGAVCCLTSLLGACGIPEQALRDEQARSRRFREAWETQGAEVSALRERVAALEAKGCAGAPAKAPAGPMRLPAAGELRGDGAPQR